MLTVHHLNNSRSQRVLWLLEELGVPYDLVKYERDRKTMLAPPELQKIHPLGKSPVITDGEDTIAESGAIVEYIVDQYGDGKLMPSRGSQDYLRARYYMHYAEGSLMPLLLLKLIFGRIKTAPVPFFIKPITKKIANQVESTFTDPNLERHVKFLDGELAKSTWFAGNDLTIADIQMIYPMEALAARWPNAPQTIKSWVERVQARPAYKRAEERGGKSAVF
ncbi:MAG: glutathione S-transferase [Deltaproteobacteria bacterium]